MNANTREITAALTKIATRVLELRKALRTCHADDWTDRTVDLARANLGIIGDALDELEECSPA